MCGDIMFSGLAVMALVGGYQVWHHGTLTKMSTGCGRFPGRGWISLWTYYKAAELVACYLASVGGMVLGLAVLFAAPWVLYRSGMLSNYHSMPFFKLAVGLGLFCGTAGYAAIGRVGGDAFVWLLLWELWTFLHVVMSAAAHRTCLAAVRAASKRADVDPEALFESDGGWLLAVMWIVLGFCLPALAAVLPFTLTSTA